jgi:hypothetical protein
MLHGHGPGLPVISTVLAQGLARDVVLDSDEGYLTGQHLQQKLYGWVGCMSPRPSAPLGCYPMQCIEA